MTLTIFVIVKKLSSKINEQAKTYFTLKAQNYTDELKDLEEKGIKEQTEEPKISATNKTNLIIHDSVDHNYEVDDLLKIVKKVDEKFDIDNEQIIKRFIEEYVDIYDASTYLKTKSMENYILEKGVYNILMSQDENELSTILKDLKNIDEDIMNKYLQSEKEFEITSFLSFIKNEKDKNDPFIYVYVGKKDQNYDNIDKRIRTGYKENIYKGLQIVYKNKMYDYSLS